MLQYILECIAFQLVFLIIYDVFLKRETFFQWNRLYLISTYIIAMVLPWIKIEAMKTTVPESFQAYPEFLWNMNDAVIVANTTTETSFNISWEYALLFGGMLVAALFFGYKLYQIYALKQKGEVHYFKDFTRVIIANSSIAFSFFKSIFLGDKVIEREHQNIVQHELVHIRQRHSYDLIFFELMRIVAWFNPLVYVYQSRVSELHEFIADAHVAKTNKKEQYELLLSEVFQTQHISFINHFFKSSLIKKRIVMLTKQKSKQVFKLKYVLVLPLVLGMLMYTSCELESKESDSNDIESVKLEIEENIWDEIEKETVPFTVVDEVPVFPGCEDDIDPRSCFNTMMQKHISKNFRYPDKAQKLGIQGRVSVMFVIAKDGSIQGLRMRGPDKLLEDEVERIIKRLPKMQPGKANGVAVNVPFSIPVNFRLQDSDFNGFSGNSKTKINTSEHETENVTFAIVDEVPVFPGCEDDNDPRACFNTMMQKHISKNFSYPLDAQEKGIQGRVSTMFIIAKDGSIQGMRMRGPDKLLEDEVERIMNLLPKMTPGKQKGEVVNVPFSIPVSFKLQ